MIISFRSFAVASLLAGLAACGGGSRDDTSPGPDGARAPTKAALALKPVGQCDDYLTFVAQRIATQFLESYGPCWGCVGPPELVGAPVAEADAAPAPRAPDSVTETNVQEAGVDEADVIKADAQGRLYILSGRTLVIAEGFPPEQMQEVGRLELDTFGWAADLYLDPAQERVVVFVSGATREYPAENDQVPAWGVGVAFIDVADPAAPQLTDWQWTEGHLLGSRRVGSRVHMVSGYWPQTPVELFEDRDFLDLVEAHRRAREENRSSAAENVAAEVRARVSEAVQRAGLDSLLPRAREGLALDCEDVAAPEVAFLLSLTLVQSFDSDGADRGALGVVNNAWQIYATTDTLYLAQTSGGWWWDARQPSQTAIYQVAVGAGAPQYRAVGLVEGWTLNQFSFSEHAGHLRVATSERVGTGFDDTVNHLFVLRRAGGTLDEVGAVRGYAPGERIFSARFLGERGYVVTFREVDPLFAFDLSDPAQPAILGELKIPGFSTYIHPLGENHLLTIGRDVDEDTATLGDIQLRVFDVSDPTNLLAAHAHLIDTEGYAWSAAEHDHRAFTFQPEFGLLSIPLQIFGRGGGNFSGFVVLRVDADSGFDELGRVDHANVGCDDCDDDQRVFASQPRRTVIMTEGPEAFLYTLSDVAVVASSSNDPAAALAILLLPAPVYDWPRPLLGP